MMSIGRRPVPVAILFLVISGPFITTSALAQEAEAAEEFALNGIEIFMGATLNHGDSNASFGASYERRLGESFGIGALVEYTDGDEWVYAVPFSWHVTESWKLLVAAGVEHEDGEGEEPSEDTYLTRIGTSYEFKFAGWSLAPEVNVDFVDGDESTVLGVSIGWEF